MSCLITINCYSPFPKPGTHYASNWDSEQSYTIDKIKLYSVTFFSTQPHIKNKGSPIACTNNFTLINVEKHTKKN